MDKDNAPTTVVDRGSSRMRLATGAQPQVSPTDTEDAPRTASPRQGLITTTAAAARSLRDGGEEETPADGVDADASDPEPARPRKAKKRRRPSWAGVILAMMAGGPAWTEIRDLIDDFRGHDEAVSAASEIGELRGRLDEQSKGLRELHAKVTANEAGDLEASFNGALEFRHLDEQIMTLGRNIDRLLDAEDVPPSDRAKLLDTPVEITERHDQEIQAFRAAQRKADRAALERSLVSKDTEP